MGVANSVGISTLPKLDELGTLARPDSLMVTKSTTNATRPPAHSSHCKCLLDTSLMKTAPRNPERRTGICQ
ncbi:hypothetical protein BKA80DRAFT_272731 [Phyllosticta citrichinensis]